MITDLLLAPLVALATWLDNTLPDGDPLDQAGLGQATVYLQELNSLLPVYEMLAISSVLLSTVLVFMAVRMVLVVRHTLLP